MKLDQVCAIQAFDRAFPAASGPSVRMIAVQEFGHHIGRHLRGLVPHPTDRVEALPSTPVHLVLQEVRPQCHGRQGFEGGLELAGQCVKADDHGVIPHRDPEMDTQAIQEVNQVFSSNISGSAPRIRAPSQAGNRGINYPYTNL